MGAPSGTRRSRRSPASLPRAARWLLPGPGLGPKSPQRDFRSASGPSIYADPSSRAPRGRGGKGGFLPVGATDSDLPQSASAKVGLLHCGAPPLFLRGRAPFQAAQSDAAGWRVHASRRRVSEPCGLPRDLTRRLPC
ncbi:hypothetical protein NDU88_005365 [Pleurodeles waltl]|uniref:Uncharacterized protein n=1 Tax=Pleurodeles waltl TaxID=8319 RepID=A0AAV7WBB2_PLEWA|nr:hypothetical protein NDU88_005365 [Pleurodeles waltl]